MSALIEMSIPCESWKCDLFSSIECYTLTLWNVGEHGQVGVSPAPCTCVLNVMANTIYDIVITFIPITTKSDLMNNWIQTYPFNHQVKKIKTSLTEGINMSLNLSWTFEAFQK